MEWTIENPVPEHLRKSYDAQMNLITWIRQNLDHQGDEDDFECALRYLKSLKEK